MGLADRQFCQWLTRHQPLDLPILTFFFFFLSLSQTEFLRYLMLMYLRFFSSVLLNIWLWGRLAIKALLQWHGTQFVFKERYMPHPTYFLLARWDNCITGDFMLKICVSPKLLCGHRMSVGAASLCCHYMLCIQWNLSFAFDHPLRERWSNPPSPTLTTLPLGHSAGSQNFFLGAQIVYSLGFIQLNYRQWSTLLLNK